MTKLRVRRLFATGLLIAAVVVASLEARGLLAEDRDSPGHRDSTRSTVEDSEKGFWNVDHSGIQVAPEKQFVNPDAGLTDEQRMQRVKDARSRQAEFVKAFNASRADPRSLRKVTIQAHAGSAGSLEEAADRANLIAVGTVKAVEFRPEDADGPARSLATVSLREVLKGPTGLTSVAVTQTGGSALSAEGPVLVQISNSELLLPGDEALLMLVEVAGRSLAQSNVGVVFFENGLARTQASSPLQGQLGGKTQAEIIAQVKAAITR